MRGGCFFPGPLVFCPLVRYNIDSDVTLFCKEKAVCGMKILVTGGAGYIGSHTCIVLLEQGYEVVIVDNLCNSKAVVVDRIKELSGKDVTFYEEDVCSEKALREIFRKEGIDAVIHFAGLKAVGESVEIPLRYYENNLGSTITLLKVMEEFHVQNIVFSSSATVYGDLTQPPLREDAPLPNHANCPYGTTKLMIEQVLKDYAAANQGFNPVLLRYFNPVGAHASGRIGEDPAGIPNNLSPYIIQTVVGKRDKLHVFGNDYPTPDGTCLRDYIHVVDLAEGHVAALKLFEKGNCGLRVYNLGTGRAYSVLEVLKAYSEAAGQEIPYVIEGRRAGDLPESYADVSKAKEELHWEAKRTLQDMCADSLRWQRQNPDGYGE